MTKDEALRLALEALEGANSCVDGYYIPKGKTHLPEIELAITAIKEALAKPVQPVQEPVAEEKPYAQVLVDWFDEANGFSHGTKAPHKWVLQAQEELRLSLHPALPLPVQPERPWVWLTDAEIAQALGLKTHLMAVIRDARAIEQALKEKNT